MTPDKKQLRAQVINEYMQTEGGRGRIAHMLIMPVILRAINGRGDPALLHPFAHREYERLILPIVEADIESLESLESGEDQLAGLEDLINIYRDIVRDRVDALQRAMPIVRFGWRLYFAITNLWAVRQWWHLDKDLGL